MSTKPSRKTMRPRRAAADTGELLAQAGRLPTTVGIAMCSSLTPSPSRDPRPPGSGEVERQCSLVHGHVLIVHALHVLHAMMHALVRHLVHRLAVGAVGVGEAILHVLGLPGVVVTTALVLGRQHGRRQ